MPSKVYYNPEPSTVFKASGGDVLFTPTSLATGNARVSTQLDRGVGAKPGFYRWFARSVANVAPTVGRQISIYLAQARDSTDIPGRVGTTDTTIATAADRVRNMTLIGSMVFDGSTASDAMISTGVVFVYGRFLSVVWFDDLGQALSGTASDHYFELQPLPPEAQ